MRIKGLAVMMMALPVISASAGSDPLDLLRGDWRVSWFVTGGGVASFRNCGSIKTTTPSQSSVALSFSCGDVENFALHLQKAAEPGRYFLTLKGTYQLAVEKCPVTYTEAAGWKGETQSTVDGKSTTVTCSIGRGEKGWTISARPTTEVDQKVDNLPTPRLSVTLLK